MASKFFHIPSDTIPVAAVITGIIIHLKFYIHCISIHKLLYFSFFPSSFCPTFLSMGIATLCMFFFFIFFFYYYYMCPICCNFSVCVYCSIP
jgi:energy-converting hydrogenase Eha subunit A